MNYQALYRKYRPKTFSDVTGQEHVTETLIRELAGGRLAHAYLFTGTRGTGKTTCAKILAKAVNCENPINGEPCNACPTCAGIDSGAILDVTEMDAASNNGVDDVRMLQDEAFYLPAMAKKRVYIIDEVHMLSKSAFNALLKTLEEPPEHLLFILATTELHKVPATILSRCQKFTFRRIPQTLIAARLSRIAELENLPLATDGAAILARLADGALRDALSLLERCQGEASIDREAVIRVLGLAGAESIVTLFNLVVSGDSLGAIQLLNTLYIEGTDVSGTLEQLAGYVRDSLLISMAPQGAETLLSGEFDGSELFTGDTALLLNYANQLQTALKDIDRAPDRKAAAELALLKLGMGYSEAAYAPPAVRQPSAPPLVQQIAPQTVQPRAPEIAADRPPTAPSAPQSTSQGQVNTGAPFTWEQLTRKATLNPLLSMELKRGRDVTASITADAINLHITHPFIEEQLALPESVSALKDAAMELCGRDMKVVILSGGRIPAAAPKRSDSAVSPAVPAAEPAPLPVISDANGDSPPWENTGNIDNLAAKFGNIVQFTEE